MARTHAERAAERAELHYAPEHRPEAPADDRKRIAEAVEDMAARLGRVEDKLGELVELLKKRGQAGS